MTFCTSFVLPSGKDWRLARALIRRLGGIEIEQSSIESVSSKRTSTYETVKSLRTKPLGDNLGRCVVGNVVIASNGLAKRASNVAPNRLRSFCGRRLAIDEARMPIGALGTIDHPQRSSRSKHGDRHTKEPIQGRASAMAVCSALAM